MENIDGIKNKKRKYVTIINIIVIILLIFVIYNQTKIVLLIKERTDKLDADPLVYGANYYNITSCSCLLPQGHIIYFDKSMSKTIINQKAEPYKYGSYNSGMGWTNLNITFNGTG